MSPMRGATGKVLLRLIELIVVVTAVIYAACAYLSSPLESKPFIMPRGSLTILGCDQTQKPPRTLSHQGLRRAVMNPSPHSCQSSDRISNGKLIPPMHLFMLMDQRPGKAGRFSNSSRRPRGVNNAISRAMILRARTKACPLSPLAVSRRGIRNRRWGFRFSALDTPVHLMSRQSRGRPQTFLLPRRPRVPHTPALSPPSAQHVHVLRSWQLPTTC